MKIRIPTNVSATTQPPMTIANSAVPLSILGFLDLG
ncbi:Protein kinase domain-containing protein [Psidium guajava]|nr:Protein kinase domain-containing protein [Psidium guajava]